MWGGAFHGLSEATDKKFMHHLKMKGVFGITFLYGFNQPFFYRWKKTCLDVTSAWTMKIVTVSFVDVEFVFVKKRSTQS